MCCVGNIDEPLLQLTVLQAGVDWQDTPKDVFISILKLIGFAMLFIDQVFPNLQLAPDTQYRPAGRKGSDSDCHVRCPTQTKCARHTSMVLPQTVHSSKVLSIIHGKGEGEEIGGMVENGQKWLTIQISHILNA